jgi:RimJ/RimL family protein N-acetyltransferase
VADGAALTRIDGATWNSKVSPAPPRVGQGFFEHNDPGDVLVVEVDGQVAGYATLRQWSRIPSHAHVLEINGLAVDPGRQGQGLGRALVSACVDWARRRGARKLTLRVLGGNHSARRLYESCGFRVEGVLREEFLLDGHYVDDVLMARMLGPDEPRPASQRGDEADG